MLLASCALALLAIALAWPVPVVLSRAHWPTRAPGTALALWQAIALGGGLAMIGSLLGLGLLPFGPDLPGALIALGGALTSGPIPAEFGVLQLFLLSAAAILAADLLLNLADTAVRTELERRRHRELVELLSSPSDASPDTHVLDHSAPVAYCLPGVRTMTVLSNGLVEMLSAEQLKAVLAHETSHLRQYHHLVLLAFRAWRNALPWFPIANRADRSVSLLVEMLADDRALRTVDAATLSEAIIRVGTAWDAPDAAGGRSRIAVADQDAIATRVRRLAGTRMPLRLGARITVAAASVVMVAFPAAFLIGLL